jgi:hypothetical protein
MAREPPSMPSPVAARLLGSPKSPRSPRKDQNASQGAANKASPRSPRKDPTASQGAANKASPSKARASPLIPIPRLSIGPKPPIREQSKSRDIAMHFVHPPSVSPFAAQQAIEMKLSGAGSPMTFKPIISADSMHPAAFPPILMRTNGTISPSPVMTQAQNSSPRPKRAHTFVSVPNVFEAPTHQVMKMNRLLVWSHRPKSFIRIQIRQATKRRMT